MKIKNYNKNITYSQIDSFIQLLPNKYQKLDIDVIYPKNKYQCLRWLYLKGFKYNIKEIFNGILGGSSSITHNKVFIYYFNFDTWREYGELEKLESVKALYHEIRHQYQKINNSINFNKYNSNNDYKKLVQYDKQQHELDAEGFAKRMMNKNYKYILNIMREN